MQAARKMDKVSIGVKTGFQNTGLLLNELTEFIINY